MTSASSNSGERLSDKVRDVLQSLSTPDQKTIAECIKYLRDNPDPDGDKIFDVPIYTPIMFRSMKCSGYLITFRMQNGKALIYAIESDTNHNS